METTGDHPFRGLRSEDGGQSLKDLGWIDAKDLKVGDVSPTWTGLKKSGGVVEKEIVFSRQQDTISDRVSGLVLKESLAVVDIEVIEEETTVYNFEVEDDHTYFVTDAEVWVHNAERYDDFTLGYSQKTMILAMAKQHGITPEEAAKRIKFIDKTTIEMDGIKWTGKESQDTYTAISRGEITEAEIREATSSDPSLADKLLSFGNELKGKWDNFSLGDLNPFRKSDPPPLVGDVGIYPIKQTDLSLTTVKFQADNIKEACVLTTTTILISNEKGEFIDINDAYSIGNKSGAIRPGKQEQKDGRTTGVNVKDPSALAKSFGVDKNMTIDKVSSGGEEMRQILNQQLANGKPAGVYFRTPEYTVNRKDGTSYQSRAYHMEVVTGTAKLGNQTVYKLHDVGYQDDLYLDPNNGRPFRFEDGERKYSKSKGLPRSVFEIWRFK